MKNNSKALGWPSALALLLAALAGAARTQTPEAPRPGVAPGAPGPAQKPGAEIKQELQRLREDTAGSFRAAQKAIEALQEEVARLRKEVEGLRQQPVTRSAQYP